jgi:hypothetical protein
VSSSHCTLRCRAHPRVPQSLRLAPVLPNFFPRHHFLLPLTPSFALPRVPLLSSRCVPRFYRPAILTGFRQGRRVLEVADCTGGPEPDLSTPARRGCEPRPAHHCDLLCGDRLAPLVGGLSLERFKCERPPFTLNSVRRGDRFQRV